MNKIQNAKNHGKDKGISDAIEYITARAQELAQKLYPDRNQAAAFIQGYKEGYKIGEDTNRDNNAAQWDMTPEQHAAFEADGAARNDAEMDEYLDALEFGPSEQEWFEDRYCYDNQEWMRG